MQLLGQGGHVVECGSGHKVTPPTPTFMHPPSPSILEKDFFSAALNQNTCLDGHKLVQPYDLSFNPELGHVECSLGKTQLCTTRSSERVISLLPKTATDVM